MTTVYVSGLHSGPSPSAGVGTARAIRAAYPDARIVGVDYWHGSSGLHHEVFDDFWLLPSWEYLDRHAHSIAIRARVDDGAFFISTLDLEIRWLAETLGGHERLLVPKLSSLQPTLKPAQSLTELLPLAVPETLSLEHSDAEIYEFCRRHSWRCWLKGPFHDAIFVADWRSLLAARDILEHRWLSNNLFLQAHVRATEESVCLAAYEGEILGAIHMEKRLTTAEGKTWAGRVIALPEYLLTPLQRLVRRLGWTGGAEIELFKDRDAQRWFNEWNPRFPAWIYGATLAGFNLPAQLIARAQGLAPPPCLATSDSFTRVVLEVPVRLEIGLPLPTEPDHSEVVSTSKYDAGLPELLHTIEAQPDDRQRPRARPPAPFDADTRADLNAVDFTAIKTPARVFLPGVADALFGKFTHRMVKHAGGRAAPTGAYSIKTAPYPEYIALARRHGLLAECISQAEVETALQAGFLPEEIVLNGPGKWWPCTRAPVKGLYALFCDSVEELTAVARSPGLARVVGVRLKLPSMPSRFGIPVDEPDTFDDLVQAVQGLAVDVVFGVHFHLASSAIGITRWWDAFEAVLAWGRAIECASKRRVTMLDLGGGWHPEDFAALDLGAALRAAEEALPSLGRVLFEPGKALTQPTMLLTTRILEVRRSKGRIQDAIVDTCIAELPLANHYPHPIWLRGFDGEWHGLGRGRQQLYGRICMEDDRIASNLALPETLAPGDILLIGDAGGYNRSMAYEFGRGGQEDIPGVARAACIAAH
jgi:diaminopimelate decarboxylase